MSNGLFDVLALQGITFPSTNVSSEATVGFEVKDGRKTMYAHLTEATFPTNCYVSLALGTGSKAVTAAQAKTLPGVTAGELIRVTCEMYADLISGNRSHALRIEFFDEDGAQVGSETEISASAAATWEIKNKAITVPNGATRVNFYLRVGCNEGETVQLWVSALKIVR